MPRPAPFILLKDTVKKQDLLVLQARATHAVCYNGSPINICSKTYNGSPKYKRSSFQSPGNATNLAKKLNKRFKTDKFAVYILVIGEKL